MNPSSPWIKPTNNLKGKPASQFKTVMSPSALKPTIKPVFHSQLSNELKFSLKSLSLEYAAHLFFQRQNSGAISFFFSADQLDLYILDIKTLGLPRTQSRQLPPRKLLPSRQRYK